MYLNAYYTSSDGIVSDVSFHMRSPSNMIDVFKYSSNLQQPHTTASYIGQLSVFAADSAAIRRRATTWLLTLPWSLSQVLSWAQQSDSISRQQPGTGQWLLDSPQFSVMGWTRKSRRYVFLPRHLIPGTGKTIMF